ncbi:MAG TPA: NTP-binding protein [Planctomycetaceae bacterium]|nr:NTP-binding protein [Planctomycetaceae bacterium]
MTLSIDHETLRSNGRVRNRLIARFDGRDIARDVLNLDSAQARRRFARAVAQRADIASIEVEEALLAIPERQQQQVAAPSANPLGPTDPHRLADAFLDQHTDGNGRRTLRYWREDFYKFSGHQYRSVSESMIRSALTETLHREMRQHAGRGQVDRSGHAFPVTTSLVNNVLQAIRGRIQLPDQPGPPCWLGGDPPVPPECLVATPSGLVDVTSAGSEAVNVLSVTPEFFTTAGVDFAFDPAADCPRWIRFLQQLWPGDPESIELLGEFIGYSLVPDTSQQKILLMVGPKRAGKGTIARVWQQLIGEDNVVGPTLSGLQRNFGQAPLLGKLLAIINDARLSGRSDSTPVTELLLSISGEDRLTIDRKFKSPVTTKLSTRIVVITNEVPNLKDASGALASRLLVLPLTQSFLGHENTHLTDQLLEELPGIFNWALTGLARLRQRGRFQQPESGTPLVGLLGELSSPIDVFLEQECRIGPEYSVGLDQLWQRWFDWCESEGRSHAGTKAILGKQLAAAVPGLRKIRPAGEAGRTRMYVGIELREQRHLGNSYPQCSSPGPRSSR